jgi:hypothetical protein
VRHLLNKLDMPDSEDNHRRVHAVLAHLSATQPCTTGRLSSKRVSSTSGTAACCSGNVRPSFWSELDPQQCHLDLDYCWLPTGPRA